MDTFLFLARELRYPVPKWLLFLGCCVLPWNNFALPTSSFFSVCPLTLAHTPDSPGPVYGRRIQAYWHYPSLLLIGAQVVLPPHLQACWTSRMPCRTQALFSVVASRPTGTTQAYYWLAHKLYSLHTCRPAGHLVCHAAHRPFFRSSHPGLLALPKLIIDWHSMLYSLHTCRPVGHLVCHAAQSCTTLIYYTPPTHQILFFSHWSLMDILYAMLHNPVPPWFNTHTIFPLHSGLMGISYAMLHNPVPIWFNTHHFPLTFRPDGHLACHAAQPCTTLV